MRQPLGKDTHITIGSAIAVAVVLLTHVIWETTQINELKAIAKGAWTNYDQQVWADKLRGYNPTLNIPSPAEVHGEARRIRETMAQK